MIGSAMLVTTCPECQTTFRVTEAIVAKASGQVRCGRCAHIFDARNALREHEDTETRPVTAIEGTPGTEQSGARRIESSGIMRSWILQDAPVADSGPAEPAPSDEEATDYTASAGVSVAAPAASPPTEGPAAPEATAQDPNTKDDEASSADNDAAGAGAGAGAGDEPESTEPRAEASATDSATDADRETDVEPTDADSDGEPTTAASGQDVADAATTGEDTGSYWLPELGESPPRRKWPWVTGTVALAIVLAIQLIHHFRGDLVDAPAIGGAVRGTYSALGIPTTGRVDLDQYTTVDLTAVAEPVAGEQGWLVIETRIRNRGPKEQPYPYIFVSLLDRWEDKIAGRYFAPDEYVVRAASDYSRMRIGSTVDAQFIIADPGPSATGFELEFCTPAGERFLCENDAALQ